MTPGFLDGLLERWGERALQAIETNGYPATVVGLLVKGEPIIERRFTSRVPLGVHLHQDDTERVMDRAMRDLRAEHPRCWLALAVHYLLPSRYTDEQKARLCEVSTGSYKHLKHRGRAWVKAALNHLSGL
jgi:hypothetical protein